MELTHISKDGNACMVDVNHKEDTFRIAKAHAKVKMSPSTIQLVIDGKTTKGEVLNIAKIAGIIAGKKTSELIPMCHNIFITSLDVEYSLNKSGFIEIFSTAKAYSKTGVEMEALTVASISALTIYDMLKAVDKNMEICEIYLLEKIGGKSGHYVR